MLLLPLTVLPWITNNSQKTIVWTQFIPADPLSDLIGITLKLLASLILFCLIIVIAKPYYPEQIVQRVGDGVEVVLLLDRSRSMDESFTAREKAVAASRTVGKKDSKRSIANEYLQKFIENRPHDRIGVVLFSNRAIELLSFTYNHESVQAVIRAGTKGKGLSETNIAKALFKAADMYSEHEYNGSRTVILISDGGQDLNSEDERYIREKFQRERITLYWLYMGNIKSLTANKSLSELPDTPDKKLHIFFQTLITPYIGFDINSETSISDTLNRIDQEQQKALILNETIPRKSLSKRFLWIALITLAVLVLCQIYTVWGVRRAAKSLAEI